MSSICTISPAATRLSDPGARTDPHHSSDSSSSCVCSDKTGVSQVVRASRHAVNALLPMVAGLIAVAVANEVTIAHPKAHASALLNLLLFGGPVLFLLALGWYLWMLPRVRPHLQLIGCAVLVVLGLATAEAPRYVALTAVGASLAVLAVLDR
jgi:low temperature requirement protein LtrA